MTTLGNGTVICCDMIVLNAFVLISIILWLPRFTCLDYYKGHEYISERLFKLMESYYEDSSRKIEDLSGIRFMHEEWPYYQMGYVMGEIIERYRKMVEHLKRPIAFISDSVLDTLKRIELIQYLYFEIYHLVNMMHEIPRKFGFSDDLSTFTEQTPFSNQEAILAREKIERDRKIREALKKKKLKEMKKLRALFLKGLLKTTSTSKRPGNKWWPIDYGWEIDYYW